MFRSVSEIGTKHELYEIPILKLTRSLEPESNLARLLSSAIPLRPTPRAELLENSEDLATAHEAAAFQGETFAPSAEEHVDLHYVCFVKSKDGNLWELDGSRNGPLNRGALDPDDDVLSENALKLGVRSFLKREEEAGGSELRFSLIVLAPSLD